MCPLATPWVVASQIPHLTACRAPTSAAHADSSLAWELAEHLLCRWGVLCWEWTCDVQREQTPAGQDRHRVAVTEMAMGCGGTGAQIRR